MASRTSSSSSTTRIGWGTDISNVNARATKGNGRQRSPTRHAGCLRAMRAPRTPPALFLVLALAAAPAAYAAAPAFSGLTTVTVPSPDADLPIPDGDSFISLLDVGGLSGVLVDVDVSVDIAHPAPRQLRMYLVAPSGKIGRAHV